MKHTKVIKKEFCCPECGYKFIPCDIKGCEQWAEWEGWMGQGHIVRVRVCEEHKKLLRGYEDVST